MDWKSQSVTLWVATIRSNSATIDFEPPQITGIYLAGTTTSAESSYSQMDRVVDIVGTNFGSVDIPNPFSLTFSENPPVAIYVQPGTGNPAKDKMCQAYTHTKLSDCRLPAGQGRNYYLTMKIIDHAAVTFPENLQKLLSYIPPSITSLVPSRGPSSGGYEVTVTGTNMGLAIPEVHLRGRKIDVIPQSGGYHNTLM